MATAPTPGASEQVKSNRMKMTFTLPEVYGDRPISCLPLAANMGERSIFRKATGGDFSIEGAIGALADPAKSGLDLIVLLWWLCKRLSGEIGLTLPAAQAQWDEFNPPISFEDAMEMVTIDDGTDAVDDSPEASGPNS